MMRSSIIPCVMLAALGCKKTDKAKPGGDPWSGGSGAAAGDAAAASADPWAEKPKNADVAPPKDASHLGGGAGDELAKLDAKQIDAEAEAKPARALEPSAIPTTGIPKVALRGFAGVEQTGFRVAYAPSDNPLHDQFRQVLEQNQVFESVAEGLNKTIRLPRTIDIQITDCGQINAFYDRNTSRIIVCYELLSYFVDIFKPNVGSDEQLGQAVIGATLFGFYHETGHMLIHQLELPAVGREEDAADQLATLILIAAGDDGVSMALSGAYWFQLQSKSGSETPFWDEHAFDGQRFYNVLCLIYGSDPQKYGELVTSGNLPQARADRCQEEYTQISASWRKLLEPYTTNSAANEIGYTPSVPVAETETQEPPAPTEPTPAAGEHAITCEQVAEKAVQLIGVEAQQQLADKTPAEQAAAIDDIKANLPAFLEQFLAQCAKEDWSDKDRQCVLDASTIADASQCGIQ